MENIDFDALRRYLMDYYGAAMSVFSVALMDLTEVQYANNEELINIAIRNNIDLDNFIIGRGR